jgi:hypothetical protein
MAAAPKLAANISNAFNGCFRSVARSGTIRSNS